jgi:hypothetical protein
MGKKLTPKEKFDRKVDRIVNRIKSIEKQYGVEATRIGCRRYYQQQTQLMRLKFDIKEKETELAEMKRKV